jgi:ribonucleoside-diphosphate reductase alpha chain
MKCRNLTKPMNDNPNNVEIYIGVDVARSESKNNNQSSIAVIAITRTEKGYVRSLDLVNIFTLSNNLTFTQLAVEVKRTKNNYNAKMIVVDSNGLGVGLLDELQKEQTDPITGETLIAFAATNTEQKPETRNYIKCMFDLKPQSAQNDIIITFVDMIQSGKLRLLERRSLTDYDINDKNNYIQNILPYENTDMLIEEIANLKMVQTSQNRVTVQKNVSRVDKDRFASLAYVLWFVKTYRNSLGSEINIADIILTGRNMTSSPKTFFGGKFEGFGGKKR